MTHGRITIITGSPGTGKSTVADKAAMESDMEKSVCIRTDDFFHYCILRSPAAAVAV